ncbi:hypothetical protein [Clostridium sp. JNZ J1-5]
MFFIKANPNNHILSEDIEQFDLKLKVLKTLAVVLLLLIAIV